MGHPGVALRDLEASRDALSRGRYQPQPTERRLSCSHRVTFLTGANRDFSNWRRQNTASDERPNRRKKCLGTLGCPAPGPVTSFLFLRYRLQSFKVAAEVPNQAWNDVRHLI